ncbi:MAG: alpha-galactosidase [Victivallaceae bacterium]|nr:alpha-galactosidase [Victivallaceae bacterium]
MNVRTLRRWAAATAALCCGLPAAGIVLPISFELDGVGVSGIPDTWTPQKFIAKSTGAVTTETVRGADPDSGVEIVFERTAYRDFPVEEWLYTIGNPTQHNSPVLTNVMAADIRFDFDAPPLLWHATGEHDDPAVNYSFVRETLPAGRIFHFEDSGGYSTWRAFPYFRLAGNQNCLTVAVGWTGSWTADFSFDGTAVRFAAGQRGVRCFLKPGESFRTPRITVLRAGDEPSGVKIWRDWFRRYILPKETDGSPLRPRLAGDGGGNGPLYVNETAQSLLECLRRGREAGFKFDAWWIDAGWYTTAQDKASGMALEDVWYIVGDWTADPTRFPQKLRPLADELAKDGTELVLWYEPERVHTRSPQYDKVRSMLAPSPVDGVNRYDLSRADVLDYLERTVAASLRDNGATVYRQDSNGPSPANFWHELDAAQGENREGITENLHIRNMFEFWKFLRENAGIKWIDNCASGGRRNDLETLRNGAVPLHYSDVGYYSFIDKQRCHHMLREWFIYYKNIYQHDCTGGKPDNYKTVIDLAPFTTLAMTAAWPTEWSAEHKYVSDWNAAKPYLVNGDYHLLSGERFAADSWTVSQFSAADGSGGVVTAVRNPDSKEEKFRVRPQGLNPDGDYIVGNLETGASFPASGRELSENGFELPLAAGTGAIIEIKTAASRQ